MSLASYSSGTSAAPLLGDTIHANFAASHGACVVIPAPAFDPAKTLAAVQEERCTLLYAVPTMFIAMLDLIDDYDLSSLRTGGLAVPGGRVPQ